MKKKLLLILSLIVVNIAQADRGGFGSSFAGSLTGSFFGNTLSNAANNSGRSRYYDDGGISYKTARKMERKIEHLEEENYDLKEQIKELKKEIKELQAQLKKAQRGNLF